MRFGRTAEARHSPETVRIGAGSNLVTRDELRQKLWPADTFVDFDTGPNNAIKKLRDVLSDSAEKPRYIETLPRRGYRFIARVENGNGDLPASTAIAQELVSALPAQSTRKLLNRRRIAISAGAAALLILTVIAWSRVFFARPVLAETDVIVLANFVNKTGDSIFDNSLHHTRSH